MHVYWAAGTAVRRTSVSATSECDGAACEGIGTGVEPTSVNVDDKAVYWIDHAAAPTGGVYKRAK